MPSLTLVCSNEPAEPPLLPTAYLLRACEPADIDSLGALYFHSYDPGQACADVAEAVAGIRAAFAGEYGELWPEASLVVLAPDRRIAAAIQVVRRAPWPDTPDCPFVIELFTGREHRRRGIARSLLLAALAVAAEAGQPQLALRVASDNRPALELYRGLGFQPWPSRPSTAP